MALILVRHAEAEDRALGKPDPERRLVPAGRRAARTAGKALRALKVKPACVVTSPYPRAYETGEVVAAELSIPLVEDAAMLGVDAGDLPGLFERHGEELLLVGHDPEFSALVQALTGARVSFPKAGAALIDPLDGTRGELRWFIRPRALALIAGEA